MAGKQSQDQHMTRQPRSVWLTANTSWYLYNFRRPLIAQLLADGYQVVALAPHDNYSLRLEGMGVRYVQLHLDNAGMNPIREGLTVLRIIKLLLQESPALLLAFTPKPNIYGCLAARIAGIPAAVNIAGLGRAFIRGGWLAGAARVLYRMSLRHASRVFFQNPEDMGLFIKHCLVAESTTVLLPGSGVDVRKFVPMPRRSSGGFVFLLVARLLRDKGIREYVDAARIVRQTYPGVECRLVGFVDNQNPTSFTQTDIETWNREGIISYLGPSDDVTEQYAEADCVVLPSYREGCPKTLLEAASMGIPIIATNVPGCRRVVVDGVNGFLCEPYDATDLARKMNEMVGLNAEVRARMGAAGRARMVREFDERIVLNQYRNAVREFARA